MAELKFTLVATSRGQDVGDLGLRARPTVGVEQIEDGYSMQIRIAPVEDETPRRIGGEDRTVEACHEHQIGREPPHAFAVAGTFLDALFQSEIALRELRRGSLLLVNFRISADPADDLAFRVANRHTLGEKPSKTVVRATAQTYLAFEDRTVQSSSSPRFNDGIVIVRMQNLSPCAFLKVLDGNAGIFGEAAVDPFDLTIRACFPDEMRHGLDKRPEPFLACAQSRIRELAIGDIAIETDDAARHRAQAQFEPAVPSEAEILTLDGNLHLFVEAAEVDFFEHRPLRCGPGLPMSHAEDFVFLPAVVFQGCRVYLDDAEIFVESHEAVAEHVENAFGALMDCPHGRLRADLLRHVGSLNGDGCQSALPGPDRLDSKLQDDLAVHPRHGHSQAFGPVADCERLADRVPQSRPCRHRGVVERRAESAAIRQLLETRIGERDFALRPAQDAKKARQLLEKEHRPDRQHIDLRLRRRSAMTGLLEIVVGNAQTLQHAILQAIGAGTGTIHLASLLGRNSPL